MKRLIALIAATTAFIPMPAFAGSWKDIAQLSVLVRASGTDIVKSECMSRSYGFYHYDKGKGIDTLTICTNITDMDDPHAVWETLAHESTHVAQTCLGSNIHIDTHMPRVLRTLRSEAPHYAELLKSYSQKDLLIEAEAFYMELQTPSDVKDMLIKACDITGNDINAVSS